MCHYVWGVTGAKQPLLYYLPLLSLLSLLLLRAAAVLVWPNRKWQNNVAVLDTERWHWRHPTIDGSNPAPRSYHSATVVGNLMVVFGGNNQHESFDKIHVLDTSEFAFSFIFFIPVMMYQLFISTQQSVRDVTRAFCGEFGLVRFLVVCFLYKTSPNPRKIICSGKTWPKCLFNLVFSWVGLALGWGVRRYHNNIPTVSSPTKFDRWQTTYLKSWES